MANAGCCLDRLAVGIPAASLCALKAWHLNKSTGHNKARGLDVAWNSYVKKSKLGRLYPTSVRRARQGEGFQRRCSLNVAAGAVSSGSVAVPPPLLDNDSFEMQASLGKVAESEEERRLLTGGGHDIAGIPMKEWLKLQKPARYLGNEFGAIHKAWGSASIRFCLTYPEIYEVGASNLGHLLLYTVLNEEKGLLCDRCYSVGADMSTCLKKYDVALFAVESRRPLSEFHSLGFSLAYELGATNILEMLHLARIPLTWKERLESDDAPWSIANGSLPLIFAGGPTATSNPEPFSDFFDFFAVGDGEDCLPEIGRCLQACQEAGLSRAATLRTLAIEVKGVYVPQLYQQVEGWGGAPAPIYEDVPARVLRRVATPNPFQQIGLVPYVETVHDRLTIEIRRGCTRGCRFCQPGMLTRPARDVAPEKVVEAVVEGMRKTGYNEFSLLSLSCSDYLALPAVGIEIKNRLQGEPISLSLPSQRVDRFDDDIANIIGGARQGSLTFAPEAGTQRLRDIINKGLTNEELLRGVKTAWDKGWRQVKLYFMIGLPGETDEDVLGIAETVRWLQSVCRRGKQRLAMRLTISNFTPKPHTPFQWHTVSTSEFKRKQALLKRAFSRMSGVKFNFSDERLSAMEDFMGRGDRSIGRVIQRAWELGATNDAWWENTGDCYDKWSQAIEESGLNWKYRQVLDGEWDVMEHVGDERFRGHGGKGRLNMGPMADARLDAPLPWDIIDTGIAKWWLKADLQRALEAATVPDCSHSGLCSKCGVCGDDFGDNVVAEIPEVPDFKGHFKPDTRRTQRMRVKYTKEGSLVLIGHLDVMRLITRALRRAALPVSFDNGFHSMPRISSAPPLPLGYSSSCELVDIDLTERMTVLEFQQQLQDQLPSEVRLVEVTEVPTKYLNGKLAPSISQMLYAAEYYVAAEVVRDEGEASALLPVGQWHAWTAQVLALASYETSVASKRKGTERVVDLREQLLELEVVEGPAPRVLRNSWQSHGGENCLVLRYCGIHDSAQGNLRPEALLAMLQAVSGCQLELLHAHRLALRLRTPSLPSPNMQHLQSLLQEDALMALFRRFDGTSMVQGTQPEAPWRTNRRPRKDQ